MLLFLNVFHILLCAFLIGVILLQPGKGADLGSSFGGGGSSSIFGPRGAGNLLSRVTTAVAFLFMGTSISLALYSNASVRSGTDIEDEIRKLEEEEAKAAHEQRLKEILQEEPEVEAPAPEASSEAIIPFDVPVPAPAPEEAPAEEGTK